MITSVMQGSYVRRIRQQLWFNHRSKDLDLIPAGEAKWRGWVGRGLGLFED